MAVTRAQKASWLALLCNLAAVGAQTSTPFWTYTTRFQDYVSTSKYTYMDGDTSTYSYTYTKTIKSNVTPTSSAYSTSTYEYSYDDELQLVYAYYSDGAVAESDLELDYSATRYLPTTSDTATTVFRMPITYTAPASCPSAFTFSTDETVSVPTQVVDQVTPVSKSTGTPSTYLYYGASVTEIWFLSAGAAPLRTTTAYNYRYSIQNCEKPTSYSSYSGGYTSGGDYDDLSVCSWYSGCTSFKVWVIIIASIIPALFLLGFVESYFWFRRLMLGKGALRFGTICWICISLWVGCFTRTQSRRSPEDQKLLRQKWNNTKAGDAFKLWWRWGFRHAYPVPLLGQYSRNTVGIVPAGQPLPQIGQPAMMYGPGYMPPPGAPGAYYPNGQPMYPPPQGWSPAANGQPYPTPPPGQAYMPPPNGTVSYYGEQPKDVASVTEHTVSPVMPGTQAPPHSVPSPPVSTVVPEGHSTGVSEAPTPVDTHYHAGLNEAPTPVDMQHHARLPSQGPPPQGPPPARPT
jgi:hypothetical protein